MQNKAPPEEELLSQIEGKTLEEQIHIFQSFQGEKESQIFGYLPFETQKAILLDMPIEKIASMMDKLPPDDRTAILETLPIHFVNQLLKYLNPQERAISIKLLGYPEDSVGRLMTPDYVSIKMEWTVQDVLNHIRKVGKDSETLNVIYAVDDKGILLDDFRIRQFLLSPLEKKVSELSDRQFLALNVHDNEENAINLFRKYGRVALPVIDDKGMMLGIVTIDDVMNVSINRDTEDIHLIGAVHALKEPYISISFYSLIRKRAPWLVILFLGELLTASAMGIFQNEIARAVVLTLFLPLIISSGGNAGSQASTLIIRAMALGEVTLKDWWKIMNREISAGIILGLILGLIGFFRVTLWSVFSNIYGPHWALIALTIFFSLVGVVLWGTLTGSMLPLLLKRLGYDPAVSSVPLVATIVDVIGLIIYFSLAMLILQGTLL